MEDLKLENDKLRGRILELEATLANLQARLKSYEDNERHANTKRQRMTPSVKLK